MSDLEVSEGAAAFGMNDALRDAFAVEVRQLVKEVDVPQKQGTALTGRQTGIAGTDRGSGGGGYVAGGRLKTIEVSR